MGVCIPIPQELSLCVAWLGLREWVRANVQLHTYPASPPVCRRTVGLSRTEGFSVGCDLSSTTTAEEGCTSTETSTLDRG